MSAALRLAVVSNIPAPYRVPVLNLLAARPGIELKVFYAAEREPGRNWDLPPLTHAHVFLKPRRFDRKVGDVVHNNPDVVTQLRAFAPQVVLTTGYNPTHLYAFLYAQLLRRPHVAMTDGTLTSEAGLSAVHRRVRRMVLGRSRSFVAASNGGRDLFRLYGCPDELIFSSPLCANTSVAWDGVEPTSPGLDLLFSGRLIDIKNPLFALDVAHGVALKLGRRVSLGVLGNGLLQTELEARAGRLSQWVDLRAPGYLTQAAIPGWFASAAVFLFPTSWDPWGVVANEACQAGVPTIVTPQAGVAGELIQDGVNGRVLELDLPAWIDAAAALLTDADLRARMSTSARSAVLPYSFANAAKGIADAAHAAAAPRRPASRA